MRIRFQADADFNQIIAAVLRRLPEADFHSATDAALAGLHDREVLALGARDGCLLVTHDENTMPAHLGEFVAKTTSPGVIVVPQSLPVKRFLGGGAGASGLPPTVSRRLQLPFRPAQLEAAGSHGNVVNS